MRLFRWPGLTAAISLLLLLAKPSHAQSQWITTYGIGPSGLTTFGGGVFGARAFGVSPFLGPGLSTFGVSPLGFNTFGFNNFGLGSAQAFGVTPFGASPFGVTAFSSAPGTRGVFHHRRFVSSAPTIVLPVAPGTPPTNDGSAGGDTANEIKQIKERLIKLENDVEVIKKRLPPGKVLVDQDLANQETQKKLEELRKKYDQYIKDNEDYNKKLAEIEVEMKKAADAIDSAKTADDAKKAIADLAAVRKKYDSLKPPPHPTKSQ
jgi:hypothetical protein